MMFFLMISVDRVEAYVLDGHQSVKLGNEYSSGSFWLSTGSASGNNVKVRI